MQAHNKCEACEKKVMGPHIVKGCLCYERSLHFPDSSQEAGGHMSQLNKLELNFAFVHNHFGDQTGFFRIAFVARLASTTTAKRAVAFDISLIFCTCQPTSAGGQAQT